MTRRLTRIALMLLAAGCALPLQAAAPATEGVLLTQAIFQPATLARSFQNDKIRDALDYGDNEPVRVVDLDLNGDGKPERFVVGSEKLCGNGGCPYTLLDGKSMRDIGGFFGSLIVLDRRVGGWAVIQTVGRNEEGFSNLSTFSFGRAQYQPDDAVLIDETALDALLLTLRRRP